MFSKRMDHNYFFAYVRNVQVPFYELFLSLDSWHVACHLSFMEVHVNMLISLKQKTSALKEVKVYISKLNTEMIDRLRQLQSPSTETAGRIRKISGCMPD